MLDGWESAALNASADIPLNPEWVSYNVGKSLGDKTIVVNQNDMSMKKFAPPRVGSYFSSPHAGYLGWGVGAALGIKLAKPESTVIATVGDGSYMFAVPSACHFVSSAYRLPILVIVYNNQGWDKVRQAAGGVHPT